MFTSAVLLILTGGLAFEALAARRDAERFPPRGTLVDVGGYDLHLYCIGTGTPTVLLENGGGTLSLYWEQVQRSLAATTRVCSYDRAGSGWSDTGPRPRTAERITEELRTALKRAGEAGPYLLVGHSLGGLYARYFASRYPDEVVGLVLVDAKHPDAQARLPEAWEDVTRSLGPTMRMAALLSRLGVLRLWQPAALAPPERLPDALHEDHRYLASRAKHFTTTRLEGEATPLSDEQVRALPFPAELPLIVIRHGHADMFAMLPEDAREEAEEVWQGLQRELARLSKHGALLVAERSGHNIPLEQPDVIVEAVERMLRDLSLTP